MALAYTLALKGVGREMVLVGSNQGKARGEAMDLSHAHAFLRVPLEVRAGELTDVADSDVVAICASVPMEPGASDRNSLALGNAALMRELLPTVAEVAPQAKLIMVSNPVDVMTWQALRLTGFAREQVMGVGTLVDSARFRDALSRRLGIHPDDLRSYVLGEHGETQFPAISLSQAGGESMEDTAEWRAFAQTVGAGIEVFRLKGHTCYAVASAAAATIESILLDEKRTLPLSIEIENLYGVEGGVCLSVPVVVGAGGVERVMRPALDEAERKAFQNCAAAVRRVIESCEAIEAG